MVLFLDYDGVVNTVMWEGTPNADDICYRRRYADPTDGKVNNYQAVQWVSELCQKHNIDIVVTSTWRKWDNYKECLINGGLRKGINILGKVSEDHTLTRAGQINKYLKDHPEIGQDFIILDDEYIGMSYFGYSTKRHLIQCRNNAGFGLEEFDLADSLVKDLLRYNIHK